MRLIAIALLSLGSLCSSFAGAQELPGLVGRVAYVEGNVALYQDPEVGWDQAYPNSPVTSENSLWTDPGARAELRLAGVAARLAESTQVDISRLDDTALDAFVVQGSLALRLRYLERGQAIEFSTPHGRVAVTAVGRYRIDVDPSRDETLVTVFSGAASLRSANGDVRVNAGEAIRIYGGADPSYEREPARSAAIDRWAQDRDAAWVERDVTRYVSTNMTGYEDLDRYGQWADEPGFGALWYPANVGGDWVPYRDGHWAWVRPWGWTWVAQEPWGYAPYHYGRWVRVRDRWAWTPGQRVDRPVWAPALVGWIGGGNFSATVGSRSAPAVGWYPLAPWERYQPWYRADANHVNRVNVIVRNEPPRQWRDSARLPQNTDWRTYNRFAGSTVVQREALGQRGNMAKQIVPLNRDAIRLAPTVSPATVVPHEEFVRRREQPQGGVRQNAGPPVAATSRDSRGGPQQSRPGVPATTPAVPPPGGNPARDNRPRFEREMTVPPPQPSQRRPGQERGSVPGQDRGSPVAPSSPVQPQGQPPMPPAQGTPLLRPSQDDRRRGEEDRQRGNAPQRQDAQRAAEQQRQDQQRAADQARQGQDQQRAAETQRQQQEQQRAGEQQRQVQQRAAEQQRAMEQQRQQQQEQQRAGDQQRQLQQRAGEQQQQQRAAEQARQAQEQQRQQGEQQRQQQQQAAQRAAEQQRQQQQQQQQQVQQQQQQAAQRAAEQQRQQQQQQQQQQVQQQQQQAAQRAAEQQRQQQQQVQQQQQQAAQRAAEAQRQAQDRAAQQRPQPQAAPPAQPQAAPPAPPQGAPATAPPRPEREGRGKGEERGKGDDRGKGREDDNPGRGR